MRVDGAKKLMKQLDRIPDETIAAINESLEKTVRYGVTKAKSVVPVDEGTLKNTINGQTYQTKDGSYGFINFHNDTREGAIKTGVVNYGRKNGERGTFEGYGFIEFVKRLVGPRHNRIIKRNIKKALEKAVK